MERDLSYYGCAENPEPKSQQKNSKVIEASWVYPPYRSNISTYSFNGEKNLGEAGPMINYLNDYVGARTRSWQAMYESDKAQIGIGRLVLWMIGKGLKPQCEPMESVLIDEGVKFDKKKFCKSVEDRLTLFMDSKDADYAKQHTGNELNAIKEKNALVGGDILTILRYKKGQGMTIQLIDGEHVMSPYYGTQWYPRELPDGHRLIDGVEIDSTGRHVAYWVKSYAITGDMKDLFQYKFERIEAFGKSSGLQMAWLYYGNEMRINNTRGMPIYSACIEKLKKMEEYSDATLNQAKEAAKVDYQVVHDLNSGGAAPFSKSLVNGYNADVPINPNSRLPVTDDGVTLNKTINVTSIGTAYNNNPGSKLEMLKNENPLYFKDFMQTHSNDFFAVINVPPNVAMGLYTDSYSASRASVMDWLNTLLNKRDHSRIGWDQHVYNFWLYIEILENRIQAPGFLKAIIEKNDIVLKAYRKIRFVGVNPPHIDPKVEAEAARIILGPAMANAPLDDLESQTERLGNGNALENVQQAATELELVNKLGIKPLPIEQKVVQDNTNRTKTPKKKSPGKKV